LSPQAHAGIARFFYCFIWYNRVYMDFTGWVFAGLVILCIVAVDLFFRSRRQEKAMQESAEVTAEKLASYSSTFEGQLELASRIYHNEISNPFSDPGDAVTAAVTGMKINWPQYTPYDIRDFILGKSKADGAASGGELGNIDENEDNSHPEGEPAKRLATGMWNTLQAWKQNPNELFVQLPEGGQEHFSRSEKIKTLFLNTLAPCSGKLSHNLYELIEDETENTVVGVFDMIDITTLDSMVWYLAFERSFQDLVKDESVSVDHLFDERNRFLAAGKAESISEIWALTEEQLLDENFLISLGHPEWDPKEWIT
jgi:hypothetical protein